MNKIMDILFGWALRWVVSAPGQERLRVTLLGSVLALAAKFGMPAEVANEVAASIVGLVVSLVGAWTARKPGAATIAPPPLPPGFEPSDVAPELPK